MGNSVLQELGVRGVAEEAASISDSLSSQVLSAIELVLVLNPSESPAKIPDSAPELPSVLEESGCGCCLVVSSFLSKPHFTSTGSKYFFKCSPKI